MAQKLQFTRLWPVEPPKIDAKDRRILAAVVNDSREPLSVVSKEVMLSRDAVDYRVKRLVQKGVITGFYPRINYKRLGYYVYHIFLLIDEVSNERQEQLLKTLSQDPRILSVMEYSDRWDLQIVLIAKNVEEFDEALMNIINQFPELIIEKDKLEVIKQYAHLRIPRYFVKTESLAKELQVDPITLDEKDKKILKLLSQNAQQSTYEIGEAVGLSSDAVIYRMKKLQQERVIIQYTAHINMNALNASWYTCGLQFKKLDRQTEAKLKEFCSQHPHILAAYKTLGVWDVLLYIISEETEEYHKTLKAIKKEFGDTLKQYDVWIGYKEHYFNPFPKILQ